MCGKGADAAAVTSLARHTLRATAIRGDDPPDELLRTLNDAMLADNPTDYQFCTVALASFEVGNGSTLRVSSGGHPLPIVLRADGEVEAVGRARHPARRDRADPTSPARSSSCYRGDTLVFYTDGITEARTARRHDRVRRPAEASAVRRAPAATRPRSPSGSSRALLDVQTAELRDDVALVVAQISEGAGRPTRRAGGDVLRPRR